uniref:Uncharacterized protein n=1 Tax=Myoviridae sp. ctijX18 TaxID=2825154 RepID=A0A8S5USY6_9CAUD|nr:MAG TPA: hypothetical protein [Myoviridae sp. ctijX18]DAQ61220.1 MAG TPA: hypothetical protein [Caudoviricetes sp.]
MRVGGVSFICFCMRFKILIHSIFLLIKKD